MESKADSRPWPRAWNNMAYPSNPSALWQSHPRFTWPKKQYCPAMANLDTPHGSKRSQAAAFHSHQRPGRCRLTANLYRYMRTTRCHGRKRSSNKSHGELWPTTISQILSLCSDPRRCIWTKYGHPMDLQIRGRSVWTPHSISNLSYRL